jgi:hypothetical protein
MIHAVHEILIASSTTTTFDVHRGSVLPIARAVVLTIPALGLLLYWFLIVRPRKR